MAVCYITEYAGLMPSPVGGQGQVPQEPALARQQVAIGAEAKSAVFNAKTRLVKVHVDAICGIIIDVSPTAAAGACDRMVAGQTEYHGVPLTGTYKLSVVTVS